MNWKVCPLAGARVAPGNFLSSSFFPSTGKTYIFSPMKNINRKKRTGKRSKVFSLSFPSNATDDDGKIASLILPCSVFFLSSPAFFSAFHQPKKLNRWFHFRIFFVEPKCAERTQKNDDKLRRPNREFFYFNFNFFFAISLFCLLSKIAMH